MVTAAPGWEVIPGTNQVRPIGSAATVNNPNTQGSVVQNQSIAYGATNPQPGASAAATPMPAPTSQTTPQPVYVPPTANAAPGQSAPSSQVNTNLWLQPGETISAYNARIAASNPNLPAPGTTSSTGVKNTAIAAPQPTPLGSTLTPPTAYGQQPTLPNATAPTSAQQFVTSISATLDAQKQQLQDAYKQQVADKQKQIDAITKQQGELQQLQDTGMMGEHSVVQQETADKQAAYQLELQRVNDNYNANQTLVSEMDGLLTTGNQLVEQMKETTGLASIMNPRIAQTMSDVAARVGVIQAVLAARNDQIGVAQNQLKTSLDAITSIASDQINYYKNLLNFYEQQKSDNQSQIVDLTKDQKTYIDAQLGMLQDNVQQTQQTYNLIKQAMLDPDTAMIYGKAGVSLTDSIQQINEKLSAYETSQQLQWGPPQRLGSGWIQTNKTTGETRQVSSAAFQGLGSSSGGALGNVTPALEQAIQNGLIDPNKINSRTLAIYNDLANANIDAAGAHASISGNTKAYEDATRYATVATRVVNVLEANMPLLANLADKVNQTGVPGLDQYIAGVKAYTGNNQDVVKYISTLKTLRSEYAQMLSRGAAVTESDKAEASQAIPGGLSGANYLSLKDQLQLEGRNIIDVANQTKNGLFQSTQQRNTTASGKGSQSDSAFVAQAVQSSGGDYNHILTQAKAGEIPVVENATGQIGYIQVGEFDASKYTKM